MLVDDPSPVRVGVGAVIRAWSRSVDGHTEANLFPFVRGAENEVHIARPEAVGNAAAFLVEGGLLFTECPVAPQRPLIEPRRLRRVNMALVLDDATGRNEILGA
jgi:hypothetical protein